MAAFIDVINMHGVGRYGLHGSRTLNSNVQVGRKAIIQQICIPETRFCQRYLVVAEPGSSASIDSVRSSSRFLSFVGWLLIYACDGHPYHPRIAR